MQAQTQEADSVMRFFPNENWVLRLYWVLCVPKFVTCFLFISMDGDIGIEDQGKKVSDFEFSLVLLYGVVGLIYEYLRERVR